MSAKERREEFTRLMAKGNIPASPSAVEYAKAALAKMSDHDATPEELLRRIVTGFYTAPDAVYYYARSLRA